MPERSDPQFRDPDTSTPVGRAMHLRDTASDVAAALEVLLNQGLYANQYSHGIDASCPTIWIDRPGSNHPVRVGRAIQMLRPAHGHREAVCVVLVYGCQVKWVEDYQGTPARVGKSHPVPTASGEA